ncbi:hypothetical protein BH09ACT5_BH09ACT5_21240 [soil metagenome]
MIPYRRILQVAFLVSAMVSLTALAPPPAGTRITDSAILSEQVGLLGAAQFLSDHPGMTAAAIDRDPAVVADWWRTLTRAERAQLVEDMPEVVGGLAGVDYSSRNAANRKELDREIAAAFELLTRHQLDEPARERLEALRAIESAAAPKGRYLLQLTSDSPPLAAIALGKLDKARMVTFAVPGMGTYTTDMQLWTRAAKNIYDAQAAAGASHHAVVAWIGYRTPPVGLEATRDAYADRGAVLLERDILGLRAVRGKAQPVVNVIAHSYGATMAAKALRNDLGVRSFVMLGSAGVDPSIGTSASIMAEHVFTGEADADLQARWGRTDRLDPCGPAFAAVRLPVDGDPAAGLLPVTGHAPIVHSPWNDDPASPVWTAYADADVREALYARHMASFGYFDLGTESLASVGAVTTPPLTRAHGYRTSILTKSSS